MGYFSLRNGTKMPVIGFGTYLLNGDVLRQALDYAIFLGYRHIDTAFSYGNESDIGQVISDRIKAGTIKRKDLFVTTKVPTVFLAPSCVFHSVQQSLDNLKMKYVDMLLIHAPWGCVNRGNGELKPQNKDGERELEHYDILRTWAAFESAYDNHWTKNIGVSNFTAKQIDRLFQKARILPSNLQTECHAYLQQNELRSYCVSRGIIVSGYSPLGAPAYPDRNKNRPILLEDPLVEQLAEKYKKSKAQILLKFLIQNNVAVLPKSQCKDRMRENLDVTDWAILPCDMKTMSDIDCGIKYFTFDWAKGHPEYFENEPF